MTMYTILTNAQLDLASSYERWQMEKWGHVYLEEPIQDYDDAEDFEKRVNDHYEIELLNEGKYTDL